MEDCVQVHPKDAREAWGRVVKFNENEDFLQEWIDEGAWKGLKNGKLNKAEGSFPNFHQPTSIRDRFSINTVLDNVPSEADGKKQACVAAFDKDSDQMRVKERTTQCDKGRTCQSIDRDGYLVSAFDKAKKEAGLTSHGAVARGYCLPKWAPGKSNFNLKHRYDSANLQKAYDENARLQQEINALKNLNVDQCKRK